MKFVSRKVHDVDMLGLFDAASQYDVVEMRESVTKLIENSRAPNQAILRKIPTMSKKQLLKVMSDFYLKGCGMGVIK
jgi:hypothetical protein|tara:strand:+ start:386 stop:616 length:231 start_codon:yes stop_codon:yes gene_type:complete